MPDAALKHVVQTDGGDLTVYDPERAATAWVHTPDGAMPVRDRLPR